MAMYSSGPSFLELCQLDDSDNPICVPSLRMSQASYPPIYAVTAHASISHQNVICALYRNDTTEIVVECNYHDSTPTSVFRALGLANGDFLYGGIWTDVDEITEMTREVYCFCDLSENVLGFFYCIETRYDIVLLDFSDVRDCHIPDESPFVFMADRTGWHIVNLVDLSVTLFLDDPLRSILPLPSQVIYSDGSFLVFRDYNEPIPNDILNLTTFDAVGEIIALSTNPEFTHGYVALPVYDSGKEYFYVYSYPSISLVNIVSRDSTSTSFSSRLSSMYPTETGLLGLYSSSSLSSLLHLSFLPCFFPLLIMF